MNDNSIWLINGNNSYFEHQHYVKSFYIGPTAAEKRDFPLVTPPLPNQKKLSLALMFNVNIPTNQTQKPQQIFD